MQASRQAIKQASKQVGKHQECIQSEPCPGGACSEGGNGLAQNFIDFDKILEYDILEDSYQEIGQMLNARYFHAVSVVWFSDFSSWCI